jgi:hypothetical protein
VITPDREGCPVSPPPGALMIVNINKKQRERKIGPDGVIIQD